MPALPQSSGAVGLAQAAQADAVDDERVDVLLVDLDAERAHDAERRLGVAASGRSDDTTRLALAERADQQRAVRDRLVAGDADVAVDARDRLNPESRHYRLLGIEHRRDDDAVALALEQLGGAARLALARDEQRQRAAELGRDVLASRSPRC